MFGDGDFKKQQERAQKLEALGSFASGIAHDFNNILSVIDGYAQLGLHQARDGSSIPPDVLAKIAAVTERGAGLTRQLLAFARQKITTDEKTELTEALAKQDVLLKPLLGSGISLYMPLPALPLWIPASMDQFTQIILNLALNARDAMHAKGELAIVTLPCVSQSLPVYFKKKHPDKDWVRISVIDNGSGIAPDDIAKIFNPFFTTKGQGSGTGLGLSVVYGIVDQIGGCIDVQSTLGQGTAFDIFIPLTSAPKPQIDMVETCGEASLLEGRTILIAEDEEMLLDTLSVMLDGMRMKVLRASNGNNALEMQRLYSGEIDFLLTDIVMPEMDGVRLGELFTAERPQSNVIYMSGYPLEKYERPSYTEMPDVPDDSLFVMKPFREDKIRQILERAMQRKYERLLKESSDDPNNPDDRA